MFEYVEVVQTMNFCRCQDGHATSCLVCNRSFQKLRCNVDVRYDVVIFYVEFRKIIQTMQVSYNLASIRYYAAVGLP